MTTVTFVRHGQSMWNKSKTIQGDSPHVPLSPQGRLEAMRLSNYLARSNLDFDMAFSSSARRAHETAQYALAHHPLISEIKIFDDLREISAGQLEGKSVIDFPEFYHWRNDPDKFLHESFPGGESIARVGERMALWLEKVVEDNEGSTMIVFSHGDSIRALLWKLGILRHAELAPTPISNTSLTTVRFDGDWMLVEINQQPHFF